MKAIVTIQNADGSYDEVGMRNRAVFGPYKRLSTLHKKAKELARGKPHRIETYPDDNIYGPKWTTSYLQRHIGVDF